MHAHIQLFHAMVAMEHFKGTQFYNVDVEPTRPALENYVARMFDMEEFNDKRAYYNVDQVGVFIFYFFLSCSPDVRVPLCLLALYGPNPNPNPKRDPILNHPFHPSPTIFCTGHLRVEGCQGGRCRVRRLHGGGVYIREENLLSKHIF